jgi:hypothetical protein
MKHGCAVWGIYLGGCLTAAAVQYELDGVVLAYTPLSSVAYKAIKSFEGLHPQYDLARDDVAVKLTQKKESKDYRVQQIIKNGNVIFQAVDTPEEFWYILREFGPRTEFTCDDVLASSVLEIDPVTLHTFVREHVAPLHLGNRENIEIVLFFGALEDHFNHDPTLLLMALREIQTIAKMKNDTQQWPREEREALIRNVAAWLGIGEDNLLTLNLRQLAHGDGERPVASQGASKVKALHFK